MQTLMLELSQSSLSSWRAWIEIRSWCQAPWPVWSLSSWRAWIEIPTPLRRWLKTVRRSPHGERGLKLIRRIDNVVGKVVALLMESVD